jgi:hypothetical protein
MTEFGRTGGPLPHNPASVSEHQKEFAEDLHQEREAERFAKAHPKRPWWRFWAKRMG